MKYIIAVIDFLNKYETPFLLSLAILGAAVAAVLMLAIYLGFVR